MSLVPISRMLAAEGRPASAVVAFRGAAPITLGELRASVAATAAALAADGVRRALLVCDDSVRFVAGLLALLHAGAEVALPPNARSGTVEALGGTFDCVVTDRAGTGGAPILAGCDGERSLPALIPERCRIDFFTSGSSGAPKRIAKTLAMLEREAEVLEAAWGRFVDPAARVFGTVSHQHIFGLAFKVMWPLASGRPFSAAVHHVWETLVAELGGPSAIVSSPAHLTRLAGLAPLAAGQRPDLVFTAGAPLPDAAMHEAAAIFGTPPVEIFGSTETGAAAWRRGGGGGAEWRTLPGIRVEATSGGLLRIHSPYAEPGGCDLADRADILSEERFLVFGRTDRVAKIEGKRVSLPELEQQLAALPWLEAAAVAALGGERPMLGVVATLSETGRGELARRGKFRFERLLRQTLAGVQDAGVLPRRWRFVDQLPADAMGKRSAAELRALLEEPA